MSILSAIAGSKTFESNPVWDRTGEPVLIDLSKEANIELVSLEYGHALKEGSTYVLLKRGVSSSKTTYRVATFTASRDWESDNGDARIRKGEIKAFAY